MPYKCTACNKSFRYKVSQRSHKCTSQPPGVVVRTQVNLVDRLTAAMHKAGVKTDKKGENEGYNLVLSPVSVSSPMTSPSSVTSTLSPAMSSPQGEVSTPNQQSYYVLVRGPNNEPFYQPVTMAPEVVTAVVAEPTSSKDRETPTIAKQAKSGKRQGVKKVPAGKKCKDLKSVGPALSEAEGHCDTKKRLASHEVEVSTSEKEEERSGEPKQSTLSSPPIDLDAPDLFSLLSTSKLPSPLPNWPNPSITDSFTPDIDLHSDPLFDFSNDALKELLFPF